MTWPAQKHQQRNLEKMKKTLQQMICLAEHLVDYKRWKSPKHQLLKSR